jgi:hypothetical protein
MGWVAFLEDWLLNFNDKMCMVVVNVVYDLIQVTLKWVPIHILRKVTNHLCEKKVRSLDIEPFHLHLPKYPLHFAFGDFEQGMLHLKTKQLFHMKHWISNVFFSSSYIGCLLFACFGLIWFSRTWSLLMTTTISKFLLSSANGNLQVFVRKDTL